MTEDRSEVTDENLTDDTATVDNATDPTTVANSNPRDRWCEHAAPGKNCCGNYVWCARKSARRQTELSIASAKVLKRGAAKKRKKNLSRGKKYRK